MTGTLQAQRVERGGETMWKVTVSAPYWVDVYDPVEGMMETRALAEHIAYLTPARFADFAAGLEVDAEWEEW